MDEGVAELDSMEPTVSFSEEGIDGNISPINDDSTINDDPTMPDDPSSDIEGPSSDIEDPSSDIEEPPSDMEDPPSDSADPSIDVPSPSMSDPIIPPSAFNLLDESTMPREVSFNPSLKEPPKGE